MMKLLKYDIKQNANTLLGLAAVLVIVQGLLSIAGNLRHWDPEAIFVLTIVLYLTAAIIMIVQACKTFASSIKAYHRRLLPLHPIWTILSSLLFSWLVALMIVVIIGAHAALYLSLAQIPIDFVSIELVGVKDVILIVLSIIWVYTLLILTIFISITIGASVSIQGKAGTWVGIISFFLIQNGISWLESLLFGGNDTTMLNYGTIRIGTSEEIRTGTAEAVNFMSLGPLLFEVVLAGLMIYVISYLLRKRVQI
ncbi:hypothetical protein [Paenibacillus timonensis]|uniref:hypothetical protein n=1 Tax=Paenibacillus timonensis TaxID=225915 RepID=UPI003F9E516A